MTCSHHNNILLSNKKWKELFSHFEKWNKHPQPSENIPVEGDQQRWACATLWRAYCTIIYFFHSDLLLSHAVKWEKCYIPQCTRRRRTVICWFHLWFHRRNYWLFKRLNCLNYCNGIYVHVICMTKTLPHNYNPFIPTSSKYITLHDMWWSCGWITFGNHLITSCKMHAYCRACLCNLAMHPKWNIYHW